MPNLATFSVELLISGILRLIGALIILFIGFQIVKYLSRLVDKAMKAKAVDPSLRTFLSQSLNVILKILVLLTTANIVGIQTASFIAMLGAASLAVGLAFQGALANFAGGVLILVLRPFRVGDLIEASGEKGTVEEIGIVYTTMVTVDNRIVAMPNGVLANASIVNYNKKNLRRVDLVIGASYDAPVEKTKNAITTVIEKHELVLKDPAYMVRLGNMNTSSLDYTVRVWVKTDDYWAVHFDLYEQIKEQLDAEGIEIPYNKLDVNLKNITEK